MAAYGVVPTPTPGGRSLLLLCPVCQFGTISAEYRFAEPSFTYSCPCHDSPYLRQRHYHAELVHRAAQAFSMLEAEHRRQAVQNRDWVPVVARYRR